MSEQEQEDPVQAAWEFDLGDTMSTNLETMSTGDAAAATVLKAMEAMSMLTIQMVQSRNQGIHAVAHLARARFHRVKDEVLVLMQILGEHTDLCHEQHGDGECAFVDLEKPGHGAAPPHMPDPGDVIVPSYVPTEWLSGS